MEIKPGFLGTFNGGGGGTTNAPPVRPTTGRVTANAPPVRSGGGLGFIGGLARRAASAVGRGVGIVRSGFSSGMRAGQRAR